MNIPYSNKEKKQNRLIKFWKKSNKPKKKKRKLKTIIMKKTIIIKLLLIISLLFFSCEKWEFEEDKLNETYVSNLDDYSTKGDSISNDTINLKFNDFIIIDIYIPTN